MQFSSFISGLISAARSTNALILTGGTNTGTMKLVGDAVREGQYMVQSGSKMMRGIKLLGLCSWGYIRDRELLVNENPQEFNYVTYNSNVEINHGENVPLNGDHTHFIMIDDGSRYRFFGASTNFITRFEQMVRDPEPKGMGIPIVTLLLEGQVLSHTYYTKMETCLKRFQVARMPSGLSRTDSGLAFLVWSLKDRVELLTSLVMPTKMPSRIHKRKLIQVENLIFD